jgi:tripartite-type tricarboxylate transporter receptor subunit TctC
MKRALLVIAALISAPALAQTYPVKPIHVVLGFAAGGGTDLVARAVGQKLSETLGQPVIVDIKVGASGIIAAEFVAKSPPDAYTLLIAPSTVFVVNPVMFAKLPYSPVNDFVPISTVVSYPLLLVVNVAEPIRSIKELVDTLKSRPQKANFAGSSGIFQLALELFKLRTNVSVEYIPYKGTNEAAAAILAGDAVMSVVDTAPVSALIKAGRLRVLAVTSSQRSSFFPDVPTVIEAGFPDLEILGWMGYFAPAGTPAAITRRLQDEFGRIVAMPDVRERIRALSVEPAAIGGQDLAKYIASDIARWASVVKAANIKPTN